MEQMLSVPKQAPPIQTAILYTFSVNSLIHHFPLSVCVISNTSQKSLRTKIPGHLNTEGSKPILHCHHITGTPGATLVNPQEENQLFCCTARLGGSPATTILYP